MCGITGIVWRHTPPGDRREKIHAMNGRLAHRGPDDAGLWQGTQVDLGHRRLSVIDTSSASRQPMISAGGQYVIVYNGEVYNYRELRTELQALGHNFRTEGDTEVLLEGFAEWGTEVFRRCNGMFAAAIYDLATKSLLLVRDRLGIKPLYYATTDQYLAFASELAPLAESGLADTALDTESLADYFQYLYTPGTQTFYQGIHALAPATMLTWRQGEVRTETYWTLEYNIDPTWTLAGAAERLDELLSDSVRLRQRSDVPLGAFLSGGLDSSSVVAATCRDRTEPLKTFSIGFDDAAANELAYARLVAEHFKTDHTEAVLRPDLAALLPELIGHFGEPFADSSLLPMWLVSKLAREQVTVALSGDGGDELFAGYTWTHMAHRVGRYRQVPRMLRRAAGGLLSLLPDRPVCHRLRRFHDDSFLDPMRGFQRRLSCFTKAQRDALLRPEVHEANAARRGDFFESLCDESAALDAGDRMLYADTRMYLPGDILTKVDRMSMAHGLEARVPLLDHRIVAFAATVPFALKYHGGVSKRPLKHLMRDRLPAACLTQRKRGFSLPIQRWIRADLAELLGDTVLAPGALSREYLSGNFVQSLWDAHRSGREHHGHRLWAILMFELWLRGRKAP